LTKQGKQDTHQEAHTDVSGEVLAVKRILGGKTEKLLYVVGILCSLFHLWVNTIGIMPEIQRNAVHYGFMLFMGFLYYPFLKKHPKETLKIDYILAVLSVAVALYLVLFEDALHARNEVPTTIDLVAAAVAIVLMLDVTRRTTGLLIPVLAAVFLAYALGLGKFFGGLWNFPGVRVSRILYRMYFAPDGIFGTIATISSTFVFLFVLFAAFLLKSGAGEFIINLAMAAMGRSVGGPAKIAVFGSGLMGSISGSAVANTVGTGSITIPMMKKVGFSPKFSGGVEAAASTGGQLMPPIMGAGAFIMSQWTQIPYLTIVGVAFIPALMYFFSVAFFIHLRAKKQGLQPMREEEIPKVGQVLMEGWNFFLPIGVLMGFLIYGFTPTYAASVGIASIVVFSWLNRKTRMGFRDILDALAAGAQNMVSTGVILLCSGIIIGVVLLVGMGIKFSILISAISGGNLLITIILIALASLILGMGLPVTASYIVLAVLAAPALTMLGVSLIARMPGGLHRGGDRRQPSAGNRPGIVEAGEGAVSHPPVVHLHPDSVRRAGLAGDRDGRNRSARPLLFCHVFRGVPSWAPYLAPESGVRGDRDLLALAPHGSARYRHGRLHPLRDRGKSLYQETGSPTCTRMSSGVSGGKVKSGFLP
jgi:TRAP transporter 4TM/12TM fusion protein